MLLTSDIATSALAPFKTALDGGFLYIYSGDVPPTAEAALDTGSTHTLLAKISLDGDGVTGLTWETPAARSMLKPVAASWSGDADFVGAEPGATTLLATFARFVPAAGDPAAAATTPRLQFTVSDPGGTGEVILASATVTNGGPPVVINAAWVSA